VHPQPRVQQKSTRVSHHRSTGTPGLPCAMVLTGYAALSPATNSSCRRHRRIEGLGEPGPVRKTSADLTPATGARTTRFCRPQHAPFVCTRRSLTKPKGPRPAITSRARRCRVHRIPSRVSDDHDTPLCWDRTAGNKPVIWGRNKAEYFSLMGWTGSITLIWLRKLRGARRSIPPRWRRIPVGLVTRTIWSDHPRSAEESRTSFRRALHLPGGRW